jgi:hypothetical protein
MAIHLKDVLLMDREVDGTKVKDCAAYVREWVASERAEMHAEGQDQGTEGVEN